MADLCSNRLIILGVNSEEMEAFDKAFSSYAVIDWDEQKREKINTVNYSFNSLVPVPEIILKIGYNGSACFENTGKVSMKEIIRKLDEDSSGYNWCINNWGTKWDMLKPIEVHRKRNVIEYCFMTAWSPPIKWLQKVSILFPSLVFSLEYSETGFLLSGAKVFIKGCFVELDT